MDSLRRNQYLQAIGVDVWVSRHAATATSAVKATVTETSVAADSAGATPAGGVTDAAATAAVNAGMAASPATDVRRPSTAGAVGMTASASALASLGTAVAPPVTPTVTTWESLRAEVLTCTKCSLHTSRTQGVFGVGNREAQWLVVGEAPGAEEDRRGEPFVGRAGHLLDAMLRAIGLSRANNVYIANVLKSRPPGNRDPKPEEVAACLPFLMRQIELLKPRVMLAVGRIAAQNLLATDAPLGRLRGKVHHFGNLNTPLIVTYHPAYLLRTPSDKRKAWEDLKFARSVFRGLTITEEPVGLATHEAPTR
jgi:uracil-DNA glycosylase